jgi:hypothetical protein
MSDGNSISDTSILQNENIGKILRFDALAAKRLSRSNKNYYRITITAIRPSVDYEDEYIERIGAPDLDDLPF